MLFRPRNLLLVLLLTLSTLGDGEQSLFPSSVKPIITWQTSTNTNYIKQYWVILSKSAPEKELKPVTGVAVTNGVTMLDLSVLVKDLDPGKYVVNVLIEDEAGHISDRPTNLIAIELHGNKANNPVFSMLFAYKYNNVKTNALLGNSNFHVTNRVTSSVIIENTRIPSPQ